MKHHYISLQSLNKCCLAIGSYPYFHYDATNGGGIASIEQCDDNELLQLTFCTDTFSIPPLTWRTTRILGLPMPPGLRISMFMDELQGTLNKKTGEVSLKFQAKFVLSLFAVFECPDLTIKTNLVSKKLKSKLHQVEGIHLQKNGRATLVGVAVVPKTNNSFFDFFLGLPNEALAILQCRMRYVQ